MEGSTAMAKCGILRTSTAWYSVINTRLCTRYQVGLSKFVCVCGYMFHVPVPAARCACIGWLVLCVCLHLASFTVTNGRQVLLTDNFSKLLVSDKEHGAPCNLADNDWSEALVPVKEIIIWTEKCLFAWQLWLGKYIWMTHNARNPSCWKVFTRPSTMPLYTFFPPAWFISRVLTTSTRVKRCTRNSVMAF